MRRVFLALLVLLVLGSWSGCGRPAVDPSQPTPQQIAAQKTREAAEKQSAEAAAQMADADQKRAEAEKKLTQATKLSTETQQRLKKIPAAQAVQKKAAERARAAEKSAAAARSRPGARLGAGVGRRAALDPCPSLPPSA